MKWLVLAVFLIPRVADAMCQRPTDPGGFAGYQYAPDAAFSFDGNRVRVWYTKTGPHAVNTTTTRVDMVPDNVARAAAVADDALVRYKQMGFATPISDGTCGGDDRTDIYLMHFNAADGDATPETCTNVGAAKKCTAFCLVEAKLENGYGSFALGARTVIAHELFHVTQDAYDADLDRFWAEGGAQWAAKTLDPSLTDLEFYLPDFFSSWSRSIDAPNGAFGYIYGAAIFPVFLTEHVNPDFMRAALESEAGMGPPSMTAIDGALQNAGTSMVAEFPTFAAWNLATGSRAGSGGYKNAANYPIVKNIPAFPDAGAASGVATGFSVFYWTYDFGADAKQLTLDGDATRVGARVVPMNGSMADVTKIAELPALVSGPGILVVAGVSTKKSDAPFDVKVGPPPVADAGADGGAPKKNGGCDVSPSEDSEASANSWVAALMLSMLSIRRRPRKRLNPLQIRHIRRFSASDTCRRTLRAAATGSRRRKHFPTPSDAATFRRRCRFR